MKSKRIYIKNKFRVLMLILLVSMVNMGITFVDQIQPVEELKTYSDYIYVTVKPGDTLWNIVLYNVDNIEVKNNIDFRDLVNYIEQLNDGNLIYSGQVVRLPKTVY